jgi:WD40 repeat protein
VKLWDADAGTPLRTLTDHTEDVTDVAYSPDGLRLVSGSTDETLKLWDVAEGTVVHTLNLAEYTPDMSETNAVQSVAYSPDGSTIASGSSDATVRLWNTEGELVQVLAGHDLPIFGLTYSPDGSTIASASMDGTVKLWGSTADE